MEGILSKGPKSWKGPNFQTMRKKTKDSAGQDTSQKKVRIDEFVVDSMSEEE